MGNIIPAQVIYEGLPLTSPRLAVRTFRLLTTGTIRSVRIWADESSAPVSTWYWNMRVNGVSQFAGANRLTMGLGSLAPEKTGLSIAVTRGQRVAFDLEQTGSGQINGPVIFLVETEEPDEE